jgi:glycosyltransferase involved in cell wall biosynthesis
MRIGRIVKYLPTATAHPGGLHAYFFTKYIPEPTLIVTKRDGAAWLPLPAHAEVAAIAYRDVPLMNVAGDGGRRGWRRVLRVAGRAVLKCAELQFVWKAVPPLLRFRPEIIHAHGLLTTLPGVVVRRLLGARLVVTIHSATDVALARRWRPLRAMLQAADRVLCVSAPLRDALRGIVADERLEVLSSAFDPLVFHDRGVARRDQVVAVGHLKWQKGYDDLLAAMVRVHAVRPACRLVIAGEGPERARLEGEIARQRLGEVVTLLGAIPQPEVARLLNESRIFVMASVSEGLPKAILEAVACGTPIVVTTACNVSDVASRVGLVVPPRDPEALARALLTLLDDDTRWAQAAAACRAAAADYDWQTVAARLARMYAQLTAAA